MFKERALPGQFVYGRACVRPIAIAAEVIASKRIDTDEKNIGSALTLAAGEHQ